MLRKNKKRFALLSCISLSIILFASCGKGGIDKPIVENAIGPSEEIHTQYKKSSIVFDDKIYFSSASVDKSEIYLLGTDLDDGDTVLYSLNLDTCAFSQIDYATDASISTITTSPSGALYLLQYEQSENSAEMVYNLLQVNQEGEAIARTSLKKVTEYDQTAITGILPMENCVIVSLINSVVVADYEGNVIKAFDYEGKMKKTALSADGAALICGEENGSYIVQELSSDFMTLTDKYSIDGGFTGVYDGAYSDGIYLSDGSGIYSVDYRTNSKRHLINLSLNNINTSNFICIGSETYFSLQNGTPTIWEPLSEDEAESTVFLTLATYDMDWTLRDAVIDFNSQSDHYFIEVVDYAEYDSTNDLSGLTVLNTEMLSGKSPDIFDFSTLQADTYISSGYAEDIGPYIENDPDLDYGGFITGVIDCLMDESGHIYELVPGFRVTTLAGNTKLLPSEGTWTLEQFSEFAAAHSREANILPENITRETFLSYILAFSGESFINYETATCDFDNSAFKSLLEFAASLKANNELDDETRTNNFLEERLRILSGKQLLTMIDTGLPVEDYIVLEAAFNGAVSYIGFPTNSGTGCGMSPYMRLGMSSSGEAKEGVWQFFKYLLQKYQNQIASNQYIPVMEDVFAKSLKAKIDYYIENPLKFAAFSDGAQIIIECSIPNVETAKSIRELIGRMDRINEADPFIYDIIIEQSAMYFSGQRSIDDVVNLIQSRAQLYLSEQYS